MSLAKGKARRLPLSLLDRKEAEQTPGGRAMMQVLSDVVDELNESRFVLRPADSTPKDPQEGELVFTGGKLYVGVRNGNGVTLQLIRSGLTDEYLKPIIVQVLAELGFIGQ